MEISENPTIPEIGKFMSEEVTRIQGNFIKDGKRYGFFSENWERLRFVFLSSNIQLHCLLFVFRKNQSELSQPIDLLAKWMNISESDPAFPKERERLDENFSIAITRNFITEFQWHVEYFLKSVHSKLQISTTAKKYYQYVDQITERLQITDNDKTKHGLLALSYDRNSLHSGIFEGSNHHVTIRGKRYDWIDGEEDQWFKWKYISIFVDECISALENIDCKIKNEDI